MLKVKEIAQILGLKKHTLLYHIRTKEEVQDLFEIDLKDNGYCINLENAQVLINRLLEDNIISEEVFNNALKVFKTSIENIEMNVNLNKDDNIENIKVSMFKAEIKHLKELLDAVKSENNTVKEELKEKNKQINRLIEESHINQQLMVQYQIERNKIIEHKSDSYHTDTERDSDSNLNKNNAKTKKMNLWKRIFG